MTSTRGDGSRALYFLPFSEQPLARFSRVTNSLRRSVSVARIGWSRRRSTFLNGSNQTFVDSPFECEEALQLRPYTGAEWKAETGDPFAGAEAILLLAMLKPSLALSDPEPALEESEPATVSVLVPMTGKELDRL